MKKTRTTFLVALLMGLIFVAVSMMGCTATTDKPDPSSNPVDVDTLTIKEAPGLAAKVQAGELPAVEDRLPEDPLVVYPYESVGKYGGTWRQSVPIGNKIHAIAGLGYYQGRNLIVWNEDKTEIVPNIASEFAMSDDAKKLTVTLRKGLKWSDGEPMTTEDVQFWWDAFLQNETLTPSLGTWAGVTLNVVDDITFEMSFPNARPLHLAAMASYAWSTYFLPKHYLAQFHPDYAEGVEQAASDKGFDDWGKYFADRNDYQNNPDLPTMCPFTLVTQGSAATQLVFERNPYYFAVDTDGNQLPYLDSCVINIVESADITKMKAISGEFEVAMASIMENFADYPLYAENAESGDYQVLTCEFAEPNAMNIHFNTTSQDDAKRAIMEQVDFRKAMALAINRPEIIAINYTVGPYASVPRNFSPYPNSPFFDEAFSSQYTEYDPDTANAMLDALGLDQRNADGWRLMSNGEVFSIVIDVPNYSEQWIDIGVMLAEDWQDVGVNASARSVDPSLWGERCMANETDCTIMTGGGGFATMSEGSINEYTGYLSYGWQHRFNRGNYIWRDTDGAEGMEPNAAIQRLWELGAAVVIEPDEATRMEMVDEIFQIHKDNLFIMGIGTRLPAIYLVKNYMKNVPPLDPDWNYGCAGHGRPEQYWIDN